MALSSAIQELEQDLFNLHPDNENIYKLIEGLKERERIKNLPTIIMGNIYSSAPAVKLVFDKNNPVTEQIVFAIKYLGRLVKAGEILSAIKEFDSTFEKGLSTPFFKLKTDGLIDTFNPTITEANPDGSNHYVYYGLKDWFKGKNEPKEEYIDENLKAVISAKDIL